MTVSKAKMLKVEIWGGLFGFGKKKNLLTIAQNEKTSLCKQCQITISCIVFYRINSNSCHLTVRRLS
mgnify:CR=1 FL=1